MGGRVKLNCVGYVRNLLHTHLSPCTFVDIADVINFWRPGFSDVGKDISFTSFVIGREGDDVNRMLMHDVL